MNIGYARVSTAEQELASQIAALEKAGCQKIFQDRVSGARITRPGLQQMLEHLRPQDTVTVVRLDRLGRSMSAVITLIQKIEDAGANFVSLTENIETKSPAGKMLLRMLASFSEYERDMIRQRTKEGQSAAKERGVKFGRKPKISPARKKLILEDIAAGRYSAAEAARTNKISRSTVSKWMKEQWKHQ